MPMRENHLSMFMLGFDYYGTLVLSRVPCFVSHAEGKPLKKETKEVKKLSLIELVDNEFL